MASYIETYLINGHTYGIEDYEQIGDHLMPKDLQHKRFQLWLNGGGMGQFDDINEARKLLHSHALCQMNAEYRGHKERADNAQRALQKLGDDPFNLGRFRQ